MMQSHDFYTSQIVLWTRKHFNHPGLDIADDNQDSVAGCRPNQVSAIIDGEIRTCLPDFSARNIILEPNLFVLGEAKTADDFLTRHEDAENQMNVMINFLKKHNMEPVHIPWRHRYFWDGGLHCITLDLEREGTKEDYF